MAFRFKYSPKLLIGLLITIFFGVSLFIRIYYPYDQVFVGDWIKYTGNDAYYQMRLVDSMSYNFPHITAFDPYLIYPGGAGYGSIHFFNWLLSFVVWIGGMGAPTPHTVDMIGVYFPVVLAALTIIPAYFMGKALFNRWAGVIAAGLMAVLPGEFVGRSLLGGTDQHIAETLFTAVAAMFVIFAIRASWQSKLSWDHIVKRDWKVLLKPLLYSLMGGLFLGIYLITWLGGLLFVFIITLYFIIQFIVDHMKGQSTFYLGFTGFFIFLVASLIFLPLSPAFYLTFAIIIALLLPPVLAAISGVIAGRGYKAFYYPLALVVIAGVFLVVFNLVKPGLLHTMLAQFSVFNPGGATGTTTIEMQPFLSPQGSFTTAVAWGNFTTSFFLVPGWPIPGIAMISLVVLIVLFIKRRSDEKHLLFFFVWTLVILIATLTQRRFAYYLVVNIALLSAYLCWQVIWLIGLKKLVAKSEAKKKEIEASAARGKKPKIQQESRGFPIYLFNTVLMILMVFFFVFCPNLIKSKDVAAQAAFAPSDGWEESVHWLKDNTPEPLGPDAYYALYDAPPPGESFNYPASAYGVTAWWDYGYWIMRTAHRLPSANPSQASTPIIKVANLFLSRDQAQAREIMTELDSSYVMLDYSMTTSKLWAVATWADRNADEFISTFYILNENKYVPVQVFNIEYYKLLCVRLYNFDGKATTGERPVVITWENMSDKAGNLYRKATNVEEFDSYQSALNYVNTRPSGNYVIAGASPFVNPIPLEAVPDYTLVFSSNSTVGSPDTYLSPEVKIFEYLGN